MAVMSSAVSTSPNAGMLAAGSTVSGWEIPTRIYLGGKTGTAPGNT